uniref:Protein Wnt n=1 Tax=Terebratalia transversa TaxID=34513 RepID=A0A0U2VK26_TERTR|nr:wnt1 [Terebratalia transversa]
MRQEYDMNISNYLLMVATIEQLLNYQIVAAKKKNGRKHLYRGVRWWGLSQMYDGPKLNDIINPSTSHSIYRNPNMQLLTKRQKKLVNKNPGTIRSISRAAQMSVRECKYQFKYRRWNCKTQDISHGGSIFGKIVLKGCRETAFIYSIMSSAVTFSVARSCTEGSIFTCTCDYKHKDAPRSSKWKWGGCSDNAVFGAQFSEKFTDSSEKGRDLRYMMNRHNNNAGRNHVLNGMRQECKCHGMSGSCTLKTCWMRLPQFRTVGNLLKERFDGASRIYQGNQGGMVPQGNSGRGRRGNRKFNIVPVDPNHKQPQTNDLVYFEKSPSFCAVNLSLGWFGTKGRECNATSIGIDGCDLLCCGRPHKTETFKVKERCNCTFHWCCKVTCSVCEKTKTRHTCL